MDEQVGDSGEGRPEEAALANRSSVSESAVSNSASPQKRKAKRRPLPPMSEIARIYYEAVVVEKQVQKTVRVASGMFGSKEEIRTETVREAMYKFQVLGVGPIGRYTVTETEPFVGSETYYYRGRFNRVNYVADDETSRIILNDLLARLWREGWQPTSFGDTWHDIRLRRAVIEPRRKRDGNKPA